MAPMQDAELIFENGQVLTMVPGAPPAQAVALAQGRVLATGSNAGWRARADPARRWSTWRAARWCRASSTRTRTWSAKA